MNIHWKATAIATALPRIVFGKISEINTQQIGPHVHNMDIQYAQSGVFTPCDFAFPTDGKRAEATPNTEMILVSDVDLDLLNALHTYGSVRNLKDRRNDVYEVRLKK